MKIFEGYNEKIINWFLNQESPRIYYSKDKIVAIHLNNEIFAHYHGLSHGRYWGYVFHGINYHEEDFMKLINLNIFW